MPFNIIFYSLFYFNLSTNYYKNLLSKIYAVKYAVPLVCIPFFGDQYNNAEALASRGVAKVIGNSNDKYILV